MPVQLTTEQSFAQNKLFQFLNVYRTNQSKGLTHTQFKGDDISPYAGSFIIPDENVDELYQHLNNCHANGLNVSLVERLRTDAKVSMVKADLDFKYSLNQPLLDNGHTFTDEFIINVVGCYLNVLNEYIDGLDITKLKVAVFLRPSAYPKNNNLKDGIHLMFPYIYTDFATQHFIRQKVMNELSISMKDEMEQLNPSNSMDDIVDKSIIDTNGWLMYGCSKPNTKPYELKYMCFVNEYGEVQTQTITANNHTKEMTLKLIQKFSIRQTPSSDNIFTVSDDHQEDYEIFKQQFEAIKAPKPKPVKLKIKTKDGKTTEAIKPNPKHTISFDIATEIFNGLNSSRFDDQADWKRCGSILYNEYATDEALQLWDTLSQTSSKYKSNECANMWYNGRCYGNYTIKTAINWLKTDNPNLYEQINQKLPALPSPIKFNKCIIDDDDNYECKTDITTTELDTDSGSESNTEQETDNKPKVIAKPIVKVQQTGCLDFKKMMSFVTSYTHQGKKHEIIPDDKVPALIEYMNKYLYYIETGSYVIRIDYTNKTDPLTNIKQTNFNTFFADALLPFNTWLKSTDKNRRVKPVWIPYTLNPLQNQDFNLFSGFLHQAPDQDMLLRLRTEYHTNNNIPQNIQPMLNHIYNVLANKDQSVYDYIIRWFAHKIQRPETKVKTSLIFKSELHGVGKNFFFDFFANYVIGDYLCNCVDAIEDILGHFNAEQEHKILTQLDEVEQQGKGVFKNHNKIKSMVTRTTRRIEKKGFDANAGVKDYNDYIMFSNNDWVVKIEASDRRFACFHCSNATAGDTEYFATLAKTCLNMDAGRNMFNYLISLDLSNFNPSVIPMTEWKRFMRDRNTPSNVKSLIMYVQQYLTFNDDKTFEIKPDAPTSFFIKDLYQHYETIPQFNKATINNYSKQLVSILCVETSKITINGKRAMGLVMSIQDLITKIRKILKDPDYNFEKIDDEDGFEPSTE